MADLKLQTGVSLTTLLSSGLNSLADGARAISGAIDNSTDLNLLLDLELAVAYTSTTPTAGNIVAEVYLVPTLDGTNYAEGSSSVTPQSALLVAALETRNPSASAVERLVAQGIPIPLGSFKLLIVNKAGRAFHASLNTLKYRTYKYQSA